MTVFAASILTDANDANAVFYANWITWAGLPIFTTLFIFFQPVLIPLLVYKYNDDNYKYY